MRLRCSHLGIRFGSATGVVRALDDLCFESREREFLTLVGPSGCGKTTLLHVLAGILAPESGSVERFPSPADSNRDVRLVCQEDSLFPWMNTIENVAFGLEMNGVPRREREAQARELLQRLGIAGRERAWPHELSLGMKQRVAVARCFACNPAVMLMDEPFAALDWQTRLALQQELLGLWEQQHNTVVFVTHDVEEALLLSDRILVLSPRPGRIVAEFAVHFPRPRTGAVTLTEEFMFLKRRVSAALGSEITATEAVQ